MSVALIPLDERPVNTRYPRMIADIAGVALRLPPPELMPDLRQPGDPDGLFAWLADVSAQVDQRIISAETLLYGGLIASRITDEGAMDVIQRASRLLTLPPLPTTVFNLIMRIPDADDAIEEPVYWAQYGRRLHRLSQLIHRQDAGEPVDDALQALAATIPQEILYDFARRRLRNHSVNLTLLHLLADNKLDLLVISSDDTSVYGMGTQEKGWLTTWARRLHLSEERLLMYPGADEVGCVLLMRAVLAGRRPTFYVHYAIPEDFERVAPYEDSPIHVTVERQIHALGGQVTLDREMADFIVAVNTPSRIGQEYDAELEHFASEHARRAPFLEVFVQRVRSWVEAGRRVIVCDVAYPNGSDPDLIAGLLSEVDLTRLAAYGAWNTAGNTIGVALAQGVAASLAATPAAHEAQQRFLLHRFVEDWGYQHVVRQQVRDALERETGRRDTTPENEAATVARIHAALNDLLPRLGPLAAGWRIAQVRLPWHRTFEVDFDLERTS
ncbi:DUF4127 family protein [Aggregatilineales bacterium SYSU G02658]